MATRQFESNARIVPYPQSSVYSGLADLKNLSVVRERLDDPSVRAAFSAGGVTEEDLKRLDGCIREMKFDTDSVRCDIPSLGEITLRVVGREEPESIKYETENSPVPLVLRIRLRPVSETECELKLTAETDLNPFLMGMADKPLRKGVEKLAELLAMIPYGN